MATNTRKVNRSGTVAVTKQENDTNNWTPKTKPPKKLTLDNQALVGLAGNFVYEATKTSEASTVAVLLTFLVRFGCEVFNPKTQAPYLQIGESKHFSRLFVAICGQTAKARKGTSVKPIEQLFSFKNQRNKIQVSPGPLSSGEGLIYAVRDAQVEYSSGNQTSKIIDNGATDKRLLVIDEELSAGLKVTKREGNTLSTVIRGLWDNGSASPITKGNRISTTNAHVCIVAHITKDELATSLQNVELLNGFANRFLWALVHRSKLVPIPLPMDKGILHSLQKRLLECLLHSQKFQEIRFTEETKEIWIKNYPYLSRDKSGLIGAVTDRAEAQTARIALIYALLDGKSYIEPSHLFSALAVWEYCENSAKEIFSGRGNYKLDDRILLFLQGGTLTTSDISNRLNRNVKSAEIKASLERLIGAGLIKFTTQKTNGKAATLFSLIYD